MHTFTWLSFINWFINFLKVFKFKVFIPPQTKFGGGDPSVPLFISTFFFIWKDSLKPYFLVWSVNKTDQT